ncbi:restriction endonuclease subunit S [Gammaproteobacteria bacterium]|nr:restriction endonuclease subunit S [Gammaproteobacteria bacterium]
MWKTVKLGDVCEILDKLRKPITKKHRVSGDIPYYGATGIVDWVKDFIFDERLVLVGEDGAKWGVGDTTAFIVDGKTWVNNHAHVLRPNEGILIHEWLAYYLTAIDVSPWITGMTVPKLNQAKLRSISIPLPPLAEQQRIVGKLDAAFAEIDRAIEMCEQQLSQSALLLQRKIDDAFSFECANLTFESMVKDKGTGLERRAKLQSPSNQHPYLKMNNITSRNTLEIDNFTAVDASEDERIKYTLHEDDFLFNTRNSVELVGKTAVVHGIEGWIFNNNILRVKFNDEFSSDYVNDFFCSTEGKKQLAVRKTGTTNVAAIYYKDLKTVEIPATPIRHQQRITADIGKYRELLSGLCKSCSEKQLQLQNLKSAFVTQELQPTESKAA